MLVTIDFETYFDKEYSLKKMEIDEYVLDDRFQIFGYGLKIDDQPAQWYDKVEYLQKARTIDWANTTVIAQNAYFDVFILTQVLGIIPGRIVDTMSMGKGIFGDVGNSLEALAERLEVGKKGKELKTIEGKRELSKRESSLLAKYCVNDVELTYLVYQEMAEVFPERELDVIDLTIRMYTEPAIMLDIPLLREHLEDVKRGKIEAVEKVKWVMDYFPPDSIQKLPPEPVDWFAHIKDILMSNDKFAELLKRMGIKIPKKVSKTTGEDAYAFSKTDKGFIKLQKQDGRIGDLVDARIAVKSTIEETRTISFINIGGSRPIPIMLWYYGAHTGRFSGGGGKNPQNLPKGSKLRRSLTAPPGYVMMVADSSQIEARLNAWLAGDPLIESFRAGRDIYIEFAMEIYGRKLTKKDKTERFVGKVCQLGLGYQMSGPKLKASGDGWGLEFSDEEAEHYKNLWRAKYKKIVQQWYFFQDMINVIFNDLAPVDYGPIQINNKGIRLPNGMYIQYRGLNYDMKNGRKSWFYWTRDKGRDKRVNLYGGKVTENVIQALARIIVVDQMLEISKRYKVVNQVHDEVIFLVPEKEADEALEWAIDVMSTPPSWALDLPVAAEGGYDRSYSK